MGFPERSLIVRNVLEVFVDLLDRRGILFITSAHTTPLNTSPVAGIEDVSLPGYGPSVEEAWLPKRSCLPLE